MRSILYFTALVLLAGCTNNISHTSMKNEKASPAISVAGVKRTALQFSLIGAEKLDHETRPLAIVYSAYTYLQKMSEPLSNYLNALDKDGVINNGTTSDVKIVIDNASSDYRCVTTTYLLTECIVRVRASGTIKGKAFTSEHESTGTDTVTESAQQAGARVLEDIKKLIP